MHKFHPPQPPRSFPARPLPLSRPPALLSAPPYRDLGLSQRRRHVQVLRDHHVSEVVSVLHAPDRQPVDVVDRQRAGQLDLDVFALVPAERLQGAHFVGDLDAEGGGLGAVAHPEVGVGAGAVVVQVGDVEGLGVEDADVVRAEAVGQTLELGEDAGFWDLQVGRDEHLAEVHLEEVVNCNCKD